MQLEVANTADVDRLTDLWVELASDQREHGSHLLPEGNRPVMRRAIASAVVEDRIVVGRPDEDAGDGSVEIGGFVMFILEHGLYAQDVTRGRIQNLYVEPDVRNQGLGQALLARAETALTERGAEVITVEAMEANAGARRLYERLGFDAHRIEFEKPATDEREVPEPDDGERKR